MKSPARRTKSQALIISQRRLTREEETLVGPEAAVVAVVGLEAEVAIRKQVGMGMFPRQRLRRPGEISQVTSPKIVLV